MNELLLIGSKNITPEKEIHKISILGFGFGINRQQHFIHKKGRDEFQNIGASLFN